MDLHRRTLDLFQCLLVLERALQSGDLNRRMAAVHDLERVELLIESLRLESRTLADPASCVAPLDFKASSIRGSESYKTAAWIDGASLRWYVFQAPVDPIRQVTQC
jgi:hypothetical protein